MWNQKPSFRFEIDNLSEKEASIDSQAFVAGGCEWCLSVYPKGYVLADGHLSLYLNVANRTTLRTGWKRSANFYFVLLNQSDKELYRSSIGQSIFCAESSSFGFGQTLPLSKLQEKGFLEKDKLIIEVYIKIVEAVDGDVPEKKTVDVNGFQVLASQVTKVRKIFAEHPDIAKDFKPTIQEAKTAYMNVLLKLIKTLQKPSKSLSDTRLSKACSELSELMNVGFKLDWLKLKLEEVSLQRETSDADGSRVQQLEERVKNLELMELGFKLESLNAKLDEVSLERKKSDDTEESRAEQERVKNLEVTRLGFRLDCLNLKLDKVLLDTKKSNDAVVSQVLRFEEAVLDYLYTKFESLETEKTDDADGSPVQQVKGSFNNIEFVAWSLVQLQRRLLAIAKDKNSRNSVKTRTDDADESPVQQLRERVKNNMELMVSQLKVELDKKKDKSCADGFLLVDEFA